jgi:transposase
MRYVGLDLHAKQATLAILEPKGDREPLIRTRTIHGSTRKILDAIAQIKRPFAICFEASTNYGAFHDAVAKMAERVVVAHAGKLRLIYRSKNKNDRADAKALAKLLYAGLVPAVHVPHADVRAWRRLITHRHHLVRERAAAKNALRALLRGLLIETPKSLWSKAGRLWLCEVSLEHTGDAVRRDDLLARLEYLDGAVRRAERQLDRIARSHPGVQLLQTIPGVGPRTAEAMVAWIDDPRRFHATRAIGNYLGLVPCEDSSAGKRRLGRITQEGPAVVRWLLNQSAWQVRRHSPEVKARYERLRRDDPKRTKVAVVAVMHYLARVMLAMLRTGEAWQPHRVTRRPAAARP